MLNVAALFNRSVTATVRCIPVSSRPVEGEKTAGGTHVFINEQARRILFNDVYRKVANFFSMFAGQLDGGVVWIDSGLKSVSHHYDPYTGSGMWFWPSAAEKCSEFFSRALNLWQTKRHARAMYFLGAAVHLVQDLCVHHHAACRLFGGHAQYEGWAGKRKLDYSADCGGIYDISGSSGDWIDENARIAGKYLSLVDNNSTGGYHTATKSLLPRAQQTTAGFLMLFYNRL